MSNNTIKRLTVPEIFLKNKSKIVSLVSYTAQIARIVDKYTDVILVGDSMGMVLYGKKYSFVTKEMMIEHGKAVVENTKRSLVVVLPFGTYESSKKAFNVAAEILSRTGASAVKLEGGIELADTINYLIERGIPVMGHVGLMPQRINIKGKFVSQGKSSAEIKIIADAKC